MRIIMSTDIKKALDSVPHKARLFGAFLIGRRYSIENGFGTRVKHRRKRDGTVGVPQVASSIPGPIQHSTGPIYLESTRDTRSEIDGARG